MAGKVFISYRREDERPFALRLYERLTENFGKQRLFFDVDSIPPGFDFVKYIDNQIQLSDIVLVVIGRNWLNATDQAGRRRLDSPEDFVRVEIESALRRDKHVIPLLVHGATMPSSKELPRKMQALARRNAFFTPNGGSKEEFGRLVIALEGAFEQLQSSRLADEEARAEELRTAQRAELALREEREAAERKRKEQEEAERLRAEEATRVAEQVMRAEREAAERKRKEQEEAERQRVEEATRVAEQVMRAEREATERARAEQDEAERQRQEAVRTAAAEERKPVEKPRGPVLGPGLALPDGLPHDVVAAKTTWVETPGPVPVPAQAKDWSLSKGQNKARTKPAKSGADPRLIGGVAGFIALTLALIYWQYQPVEAIIFGSVLTAGGAVAWSVVEALFVGVAGRAKKARETKGAGAPGARENQRQPARKTAGGDPA